LTIKERLSNRAQRYASRAVKAIWVDYAGYGLFTCGLRANAQRVLPSTTSPVETLSGHDRARQRTGYSADQSALQERHRAAIGDQTRLPSNATSGLQPKRHAENLTQPK
jgi:hypothetical protein